MAAVGPQGRTPRLRLRKADKLRLRAQFDQLRREGNKRVGPALVAVVAPAPEGRTQCGVICSRKYSLKSVVRNRARRLLWESFRLLKPELPVCRILLIPRRRMLDYDRRQTTAELRGLLADLGVLGTGSSDCPPAARSESSGSTSC